MKERVVIQGYAISKCCNQIQPRIQIQVCLGPELVFFPPPRGTFKEKALALESGNLVLNPSTVTHMLYDLGQIT